MADVAANGEAVVTADGACEKVSERITRYATRCVLTDGGLEGVGSTEHDAAGLDGVKSLPDHGDDGAGGHVLDQAGEEGLALEIGVVCGQGSAPARRCDAIALSGGRTLLEVLLGGVDELEGDQLEAALLEAGDDLADEVALNAVRLVGAVSAGRSRHRSGADLDHDVGALGDGHGCRMKIGDDSKKMRASPALSTICHISQTRAKRTPETSVARPLLAAQSPARH